MDNCQPSLELSSGTPMPLKRSLLVAGKRPRRGLHIPLKTSNIQQQYLLSILQSQTVQPRQQHFTAMSRTGLEAKLRSTLHSLWVDTTWARRASTLHRMVQLAEHLSMPTDQHAAALWAVSAPAIKTRLARATECQAILKRFGMDTELLSLLANSLRGCGALIPDHQAPPCTVPELERLIKLADLPLQTAMQIAWKTCSRWDEVERLTKESFILVTPTLVVIDWADKTKGSRKCPFRASKYTEISGPRVKEICAFLKKLPRWHKVSQMSTTAMDAWLKNNNSHLSAHSFKRGALDVLAMKGIPHQLISLMAKHKRPDEIKADTIRYLSPLPAAHLTGTAAITKYLP